MSSRIGPLTHAASYFMLSTGPLTSAPSFSFFSSPSLSPLPRLSLPPLLLVPPSLLLVPASPSPFAAAAVATGAVADACRYLQVFQLLSQSFGFCS